jgi:hypothetical protein
MGFTTPHGVVASGPMLMAVIGIAAVAAVVAAVNVISMGPTIVRIVEPFPAGSGRLVVVVFIVVVVLDVVWIGVGVVVHSLRKTSGLRISGQLFAQIEKTTTSDNTSKYIIPGSIPGDI